MKVDVSLCGVLRHRESAGPAAEAEGVSANVPGELELAEGATIAQAAAQMGLADGLGWIACVNGRPAAKDAPLSEGDEVYLFLPVSGG
jgi:sulfur carrier protein ThiS